MTVMQIDLLQFVVALLFIGGLAGFVALDNYLNGKDRRIEACRRLKAEYEKKLALYTHVVAEASCATGKAEERLLEKASDLAIDVSVTKARMDAAFARLNKRLAE